MSQYEYAKQVLALYAKPGTHVDTGALRAVTMAREVVRLTEVLADIAETPMAFAKQGIRQAREAIANERTDT